MTKVIRFLNDHYSFDLTKTGTLKLAGGKRLNSKAIADKLNDVVLLKRYELLEDVAEGLDLQRAIDSSLSQITNELRSQEYAESMSGVPEEYLPNNILVGVDQRKKDVFVLNKKYEVMPINVDSWKEVLGHKAYGDLDKVFCKLIYNPYTTKKVIDESKPIKVINTCCHPEWRYSEEEPKKLDPLFLEFFEGFFKTKESLQYTCSWYLNSIYDRNETALVLVGAKAIGKNIFCSTFNRMVGEINVSNQANNAYTEKFNGFLKNKRIVVADEVSFKDGQEKNRVKKYFNKLQSIEEKGRDAETIEVFVSMVMLSNDVRDLYIEADDRRFSCIDLTDKTLPSRMTPKQIIKLKEYIDYDPDFPLAFHKYLEDNKTENFTNALPFKGQIFDKLVLSSLSGVKLAILNKIIEGVTSHFTLGELDFDWDKEFPRRKPSFYYFEEFMTNFMYEGKKLGTITPAKRTLDYIIKPNPDLLVTGFKSEL
jgi:hypothetical protein